MLKVGKNTQLFTSQFAFDFSVKENNCLTWRIKQRFGIKELKLKLREKIRELLVALSLLPILGNQDQGTKMMCSDH